MPLFNDRLGRDLRRVAALLGLGPGPTSEEAVVASPAKLFEAGALPKGTSRAWLVEHGLFESTVEAICRGRAVASVHAELRAKGYPSPLRSFGLMIKGAARSLPQDPKPEATKGRPSTMRAPFEAWLKAKGFYDEVIQALVDRIPAPEIYRALAPDGPPISSKSFEVWCSLERSRRNIVVRRGRPRKGQVAA